MKMSKRMAALCCAGLLTFVTACNKSTPSSPAPAATDNSSTTTAPADANTPADMRFSWWGGDARHEATLAVIEKYTTENPNVTIEGEFGGYDGYDEKLATQIAGRTVADIVQIVSPRLQEFGSKNDIFVNLYDQDVFQLDGFDKTFTENFGMVDGKLLGVPTGINAYGFVLNKKVFEKAGIELPTSLTWDDMFTLGAALQAADPNLYLFTADKDDWNHIMRSYLRQRTGEWPIQPDFTVTTDREALVDAFTFVQRLYTEKVAEPMETAYPYYGKIWEDKKWHAGEIAMMYHAAARLPQYKSENVELATINIPALPNAKKSGIITQPAQMLAITKQGNEQAALKFANYFYNDPAAIDILADVRGVPATEAARTRLSDAGKLDPVASKAVSDALSNTDEPVPAICENSEVYRISFEIWEQVCFGKLTPEQAADKYLTDIQRLLDELKAAA